MHSLWVDLCHAGVVEMLVQVGGQVGQHIEDAGEGAEDAEEQEGDPGEVLFHGILLSRCFHLYKTPKIQNMTEFGKLFSKIPDITV